MPPLSDNYDILCCKDGSISSIDGAYLCPDFPDEAEAADAAYSETLQHIQDTGLSVERLLCFASAVLELLDGHEWGADTLTEIAAAVTTVLGIEVSDLLTPSDDDEELPPSS